MARRFNPPPDWPTPARGWRPPPGWKPDPSWPPPPEGWSFWVDDGSRRRTILATLAGVGALVLFLLGIGTGGTVAGSPPTATPAASAVATTATAM